MRTPTEGAVYDADFLESPAEAVETPDTFGKSTAELENSSIWFRSLDDDERFSIFVDNFGRKWSKVADSVDEYDA